MNDAIAVIGAGSWGSALAIHLARNQQSTSLWGRDVHAMQASRSNVKYLPNIEFPKALIVCDSLEKAVRNVGDILLCMPSHAFRQILKDLKPLIAKDARIVWGTKGFEPKTGLLLNDVVRDELGKHIKTAILSGPSFAMEVAKGMPTAVTIASHDKTFADDLVSRFHSQTFRPYKSSDMIGVQVGGVVKNVMAIAVGIADGLNFGANAKSALITRGLAEIVRLGLALGGKQETFMGLSGVGDLILTCTDDLSRNRRFGLALGAGKSIKAAILEIGQVVEGAKNAKEVHNLAQKLRINMPITEQVNQILHHGAEPKAVVELLLSRHIKSEFDA